MPPSGSRPHPHHQQLRVCQIFCQVFGPHHLLFSLNSPHQQGGCHQQLPGIDLAAIAADQDSCSDSTALAANKAMGTIKLGIGERHILCSTATGTIRPIVPGNHCLAVFATGPPGHQGNTQLISSCCAWKGMSTAIAAWCRDCQHCQQSKVTQEFTGPVQPIVVPSRHFSHNPGKLQHGPEQLPVAFAVTDSSTPQWIPTRPPPVSSGSSLLPNNLAGANFVYICQSGISKLLTPHTAAPMRCWSGLRSPSKSTSVTAPTLFLLTASSHTWDPPLFCLPQHPGEGGPLF